MEFIGKKFFFNKNKLKNSESLNELWSVNSLITSVSKVESFADFSISNFENTFQKILNSCEPTEYVLRHVKQYALDSKYSPSVASANFVHLFANDLCQLYIGSLSSEQTKRNMIFTAPCNFLFAPLNRDAEVFIKKYLLPKDWNCEIYDTNTKLELVDEFSLRAGQYINVPRNGNCIDSQKDQSPSDSYIYDFTTEKPVIWLRLASNATAFYQWVFDKDTLKPSFMSSSSLAQTRYETIIQVINSFRESGENVEKYLDVLESLTANPLHHIRWAATQELFEANQTRGINAVKKLIDDTHPHVKKAAIEALIQLRNYGVVV